MRALLHFFLVRPVWVNVILITTITFGLLSLFQMRSSFFAPIDNRQILVQIAYPGSSPQEIEESIILKIEDNLKGIQGIERSTSVSRENSGTVTVEIEKGTDGERVLEDVKNAVNEISSFPSDMEPPRVYRVPIEDFAISFALIGDVNLSTLKKTAQEVERHLLAIDGISLVDLSGFPDQEIEVTVREETLLALGLTISDVGNAIRNARIERTGGELKNDNERITVRMKQRPYFAKDLRDVIVQSDPDGRIIYLDDIADISDTWNDSPRKLFFNDQPSVAVNISKTVSEDILFISQTVNDYIERFNEENTTIRAQLIRDSSVVLKQRITLLSKNGITGFILVLALLALFLNWRLAFWVAAAIPISFLGMFIVGEHLTSMTINVISLFGMIVVIGILVDDGIVIGENIFQQAERGKSRIQAALDGTLEVFPSVFSAILTTIIAFTPFFFLDGRIADIMNNMALVVIITLAISLIEGLIILPSHLAHSKALQSTPSPSLIRRYSQRCLRFLRNRIYSPLLKLSIRHNIIAVLIPVLLMILTIGAAKGGIVTSTFFPFVDSDDITINVTLPSGVNERLTKDVLDQVEHAVWKVNDQFKSERDDGLDVIENVKKELSGESNKGSLAIALLDGERRNMESFLVNQAIRKALGPIPIAESIEIGGRGFFGKAISVSLLGNNLDDLRAVKEQFEAALTRYDKVKDITDNDQQGMQEIYVSLEPHAYSLGLTDAYVINQVRNNLFGFEVSRTQRGSDEVKIWVRYDDADRQHIGQLENMRIQAPNGDVLPLAAVAQLELKRSSMIINHLNGFREIKVEANLADAKDPVPPILSTVLDDILAPILKKYPSVSFSLEGQKRQTDKTSNSAKVVMPITLFAMFMVIVLGYRSFTQAIITVLLVPFGYIGMAWGHVIHGLSINLLSIFGFIALIGIIVNDSIVLTNSFNRHIAGGLPVPNAVFKAGLSRFRPILLTSITTIFGLGPLILEKSRQAQFLVPMAVSVAYGLFIATFIILLMLPALLVNLAYIRLFFARIVEWMFGQQPCTIESLEPAYERDRHDS